MVRSPPALRPHRRDHAGPRAGERAAAAPRAAGRGGHGAPDHRARADRLHAARPRGVRVARGHVGERRRRVLRSRPRPGRVSTPARSRTSRSRRSGPAPPPRSNGAASAPIWSPSASSPKSLLEAFGAHSHASEPGVSASPPGNRVLARAEQARDVLPDGLEARGYAVDVLPVYRTVRAAPAPDELERVRPGGRRDHVHLLVDRDRVLRPRRPAPRSPAPHRLDRSHHLARRGGAGHPGGRRGRPALHRRARRAPRCAARGKCGVRAQVTWDRGISRAPVAPAPPQRPDASPHRRDPAVGRRSRGPALRQGGHRRPGTGRLDARRGAAHAGEPAQRGAGTGRSRRPGGHPVRHPGHKDARGSGADDPTAWSRSRCVSCATRSATRSSSWPTPASTSTPTTGTAGCSTRPVRSTTTRRSSATRASRSRRPTPAPT